MTENVQNLQQQIQEQTVHSAQDFYGNSIGQLKGQLQNDRTQLESLLEQLPEDQEDARAQIQEMVDSYESIESSLDEVTQSQGIEDRVNEAVRQVQDAAGGAVQQVQDTAGQATDQAGEAVDQATGAAQDLAPGTELLGETVNDAGQ